VATAPETEQHIEQKLVEGNPSLFRPGDIAKKERSSRLLYMKEIELQDRPLPKKKAKLVFNKNVVCFVCGKLFSVEALQHHLQWCMLKQREMNALLPEELRPAPQPQPKLLLPTAHSSKQHYEAFNAESVNLYRNHLPQCTECGRRLPAGQVVGHVSACRINPFPLAVGLTAEEKQRLLEHRQARNSTTHSSWSWTMRKKDEHKHKKPVNSASPRPVTAPAQPPCEPATPGKPLPKDWLAVPADKDVLVSTPTVQSNPSLFRGTDFAEMERKTRLQSWAPSVLSASDTRPREHKEKEKEGGFVKHILCDICLKSLCPDSLRFHKITCKRQRDDQLQMLPVHLRPPSRVSPTRELPRSDDKQSVFEAYNNEARELHHEFMPRCVDCGRRFFDAATLLKHLVACNDNPFPICSRVSPQERQALEKRRSAKNQLGIRVLNVIAAERTPRTPVAQSDRHKPGSGRASPQVGKGSAPPGRGARTPVTVEKSFSLRTPKGLSKQGGKTPKTPRGRTPKLLEGAFSPRAARSTHAAASPSHDPAVSLASLATTTEDNTERKAPVSAPGAEAKDNDALLTVGADPITNHAVLTAPAPPAEAQTQPKRVTANDSDPLAEFTLAAAAMEARTEPIDSGKTDLLDLEVEVELPTNDSAEAEGTPEALDEGLRNPSDPIDPALFLSPSQAGVSWASMVQKLPYQKSDAAHAEREALWTVLDSDSRGQASLDAVEQAVRALLGPQKLFDLKPVLAKAHSAYRDLHRSSRAREVVEFKELRAVLWYLRQYIDYGEKFHGFEGTRDRLLTFGECEKLLARVSQQRGVLEPADAPQVFRSMDADGSGRVPFDEFVFWAISHHLDLEADTDLTPAKRAPALKAAGSPAKTYALGKSASVKSKEKATGKCSPRPKSAVAGTAPGSTEPNAAVTTPNAKADVNTSANENKVKESEQAPDAKATKAAKANSIYEALEAKLPWQKTPEAQQRRAEMFRQFDPNGNGFLSLAELDKGVKEVVQLDKLFAVKPVLLRAFNAARNGSGTQTGTQADYIELKEFRKVLWYLRQYFEYWTIFDRIDSSDDRRIDLAEFTKSVPYLQQIGVVVADPASTFASIDQDGFGKILFDEFCNWAIKVALDADDDDDSQLDLGLQPQA
jgi:Ca2+-binding EF-hand superfamily protein